MKIIFALIALTIIPQASFAWRAKIGSWEMKGKDIKVIVVITREAQHGAGAVAAGASHLIGQFMHVTGIEDAIEHNTKFFDAYSRFSACIVTTCASEVIRHDEIRKLKAEQNERLQLAIAQVRSAQDSSLKREQIQTFQNLELVSRRDLALNQADLKLTDQELEGLTGLIAAIQAETDFRTKLAAQNIHDRPLTSTEVVHTAQDFEKAFSQDLDRAATEMNSSLNNISKQTGRSLGRLQAEMIRALEDASLSELQQKLTQRQMAIQQNREKIQEACRNNQATLTAAATALKGLGVE